jgi:DNA-binding response OmpR family regulator
MELNAGAPLHILLVEQDAAICELFSSLFQAHGHAVSIVNTGTDAIALADNDAPHVVFSSLVFHDMDGFDLCRRLRAMPATTGSLIVALTGYAETGIREKVLEAGFDSYLLKPVGMHTLLEQLEAFQSRRTQVAPRLSAERAGQLAA